MKERDAYIQMLEQRLAELANVPIAMPPDGAPFSVINSAERSFAQSYQALITIIQNRLQEARENKPRKLPDQTIILSQIVARLEALEEHLRIDSTATILAVPTMAPRFQED